MHGSEVWSVSCKLMTSFSWLISAEAGAAGVSQGCELYSQSKEDAPVNVTALSVVADNGPVRVLLLCQGILSCSDSAHTDIPTVDESNDITSVLCLPPPTVSCISTSMLDTDSSLYEEVECPGIDYC